VRSLAYHSRAGDEVVPLSIRVACGAAEADGDALLQHLSAQLEQAPVTAAEALAAAPVLL